MGAEDCGGAARGIAFGAHRGVRTTEVVFDAEWRGIAERRTEDCADNFAGAWLGVLRDLRHQSQRLS